MRAAACITATRPLLGSVPRGEEYARLYVCILYRGTGDGIFEYIVTGTDRQGGGPQICRDLLDAGGCTAYWTGFLCSYSVYIMLAE